MKKTRHLIVLVAGLVTVLGSGGWLWHSRYADKPLNCIGNMEWNIGSNRFTGTLSFRCTTVKARHYYRQTVWA